VKTLIKICTAIGMIIVVLFIIGTIVTAAINIICGLFTAAIGGCILLACWAILKGLAERFRQSRNLQATPSIAQ